MSNKEEKKDYIVRIQSTVSYDFEVEIEARDMGEAEAIADNEYWTDQYHGEARPREE